MRSLPSSFLKGREDKDRDENIAFEHVQMKIKKVTGTLRNFGNTIDIWSDGFLNYSMVMVDFFRSSIPFSVSSALDLSIQNSSPQLNIRLAARSTSPSHRLSQQNYNGNTYRRGGLGLAYCSLLWVLPNPTTGSRKRAAFSILDNANGNKKHSG